MSLVRGDTFPDALAIVHTIGKPASGIATCSSMSTEKPVGPLRSELRRTCKLLDIPYGRKHGKVFHDTRHTAKTNLTEAGVPDEIAMTITGHKDVTVFKSYHVRRQQAQADALRRLQDHPTKHRPGEVGTTTEHDRVKWAESATPSSRIPECPRGDSNA